MGPSLSSHHPMITLSKAGTFKPKILFPTVHQEPSRVSLALANPLWKQAMTDEFQALLCNQTWNLVPPSSAQRVVQCKWVFQTKLMANVSLDKHKARLVAKGFQQTPDVDFFETFSPVVKASTIRIIFILAVSKGWDIQQIDINNHF